MADETLAYVANYHPPVGHLIHQTGMVPIMTEMMDDPNQEYVADGGTAVAGMIHSILSKDDLTTYSLYAIL